MVKKVPVFLILLLSLGRIAPRFVILDPRNTVQTIFRKLDSDWSKTDQ
jgi:hypothetical protein